MHKLLLHAASRLNMWVYRASGGRWLGRMPSGAPICLLTTTGHKSGSRRRSPLLYLRDGSDFVVVASQGGAPRHPGWYFNLRADPKAEVQIGSSRLRVIARDVGDDERAALWPRLVAMYPPYEAYQRRTTRRIPVVRLSLDYTDRP